MSTDNPSPEDHELLLSSVDRNTELPSVEMPLKREERPGDRLAEKAALSAAGLLLGVTWFIVLTTEPTSKGWFAFHPLLQTLAVGLFTYGILTLQPTSQPVTKAAGLSRHQLAIAYIGLPVIFLGTLSVWYNKWLRGANHFTTWHGKFGLLSMLWLLAQVLLGGGSVWFKGAAFGGGMKAKAIWKYHRLSGYLLFPLMLATVNLGGYWSHWGERSASTWLRFTVYGAAPLVMIASILVRLRTSKMNFF